MLDLSDTKDEVFQIITSAHDDCRRQIAAGKVQRWDVFKWGVAVNVALATAATAVTTEQNVRLVLFALAVAATIASLSLVKHYNRRMTGARRTATTLTKRLKSFHIDYDAILETDVASAYSAGEDYDCQELLIFWTVLIVSPALVLLKDIVSAASISHSIARATCLVLAVFAITLLSEMLVCFSSRAQVRRATKIHKFLRSHATAIRRIDVIVEIISDVLLVSAVVAASAIL